MRHTEEKAGSAGLDRRRFLTLGSAAAVAAAVPLEAWGSNILGLKTAHDLAMSVGFVAGSDSFESFETLPWDAKKRGEIEVIPATQFEVGDQNLASTLIRMTVHGLYPRTPPKRVQSFRETNLVVLYPSPDPVFTQPLPFIAWGLRRQPWRSQGARTRYTVPLREDGGLALALEVTLQNGPVIETVRYFTDFTVDWYAGRPKLGRGIYLLGLGLDTWSRTRTLPGAGDPIADNLCSVAVSFEPVAEEPEEE